MLIDHLNQQLLERAAEGLQRQRRTAHTACAPRQQVRAGDGAPPRDLLGFCSNDYLGLANHPALIEAITSGVHLYGAGSGASHLVSGHSQAHEALESLLAQWMAPAIPQARVLTFSTGYMANLALLTALADEQATLFCDKLNHASLIDGARLSKAEVRRYPHGDLAALERQLSTCTTPLRLIVTDTVFSMDGDQADLPALLALAERFDAWLILDDAHGFGVLGPQGQGSLAQAGLRSERFILMGTLGKAAGVSGAFVAAHPIIIDWLMQTARTAVFTTASPPALAHALLTSLQLIASEEGVQRRARLQQHIAQLRSGLQTLIAQFLELGWSMGASDTPIQPLIVGDNAQALSLSSALDAQGLWIPAIRPPTVPVGKARLRITLSAAHTSDDIQRLLAALHEIARDFR
ncbi:8-amino-7-oxononanoate synthase [Thiomonas bhubaneswarensis]|uniref:8-amino-7-oxononanoate synthase n=1 Tax=Thiomonas bhubaneswarensis TaxID=339866 RepID=A0A0K6IAA0_9BURK|nr:8-amino-7-oxononanoate synthase [Thiomonas bhubaneswarensis]CUB00237.1 8-amino-7-oxononanoate synthase [Thiomonas bhubaneswarensis]